jgi:hypothetical protein
MEDKEPDAATLISRPARSVLVLAAVALPAAAAFAPGAAPALVALQPEPTSLTPQPSSAPWTARPKHAAPRSIMHPHCEHHLRTSKRAEASGDVS